MRYRSPARAADPSTAGAVPGQARALLAFAGFGGFWGAWGVELPAIQSNAGVSDGTLGLALLFIGAGHSPR